MVIRSNISVSTQNRGKLLLFIIIKILIWGLCFYWFLRETNRDMYRETSLWERNIDHIDDLLPVLALTWNGTCTRGICQESNPSLNPRSFGAWHNAPANCTTLARWTARLLSMTYIMKAGIDVGNKVREVTKSVHTGFIFCKVNGVVSHVCVHPFTRINIFWEEKLPDNVHFLSKEI